MVKVVRSERGADVGGRVVVWEKLKPVAAVARAVPDVLISAELNEELKLDGECCCRKTRTAACCSLSKTLMQLKSLQFRLARHSNTVKYSEIVCRF